MIGQDFSYEVVLDRAREVFGAGEECCVDLLVSLYFYADELEGRVRRLEGEKAGLLARCIEEKYAVSQAEKLATVNERLEFRVNRLLETNRCLMDQIDRLTCEKQRLMMRVGELSERVGLSSKNSSLPPSQDRPWTKPIVKHRRSGLACGGQPGHKGNYRKPVGEEQVNSVVDHWPSKCTRCEEALTVNQRVDCAEVQRHQVFDLPEISVEVVEHRLHKVVCPNCKNKSEQSFLAMSRRVISGPNCKQRSPCCQCVTGSVAETSQN